MVRIESLLSARLFMQPQLHGHRIYFISNLSGHLSLYAMDHGGSVPEPLLPPHLALQNPHLIGGKSFFVFPELGRILVMVDRDGDERYQPMEIPLDGGFPTPAFGSRFDKHRTHLVDCDAEANLVYLVAESTEEDLSEAFQGNLATRELVKLGESRLGITVDGVNAEHTRAALIESYTFGDDVLFHWGQGAGGMELLYGAPLASRKPGEPVETLSIDSVAFTPGDRGLLFRTARFSDTFGLGYLDLSEPADIRVVEIQGTVHTGQGELESVLHLEGDRYLLIYNIDGASWAYEGRFNEGACRMELENTLAGQGELANGVLESISYEKATGRFALAFSTATSPTQIYTVEGRGQSQVLRHTNEKILGVPQAWLSEGEDCSFVSHDGTRVSARLYLPSPSLDFSGPRPVVYYIHGGPQGQERPDFAWFSMPLIQFLTLNGFAVFVPNVRGSTGYGLRYTQQVDRDWGGKDRLDHVHAMQVVLPQDPRLDTSRTGVVGRSYGGYMTLMLVGRHPDLWAAGVDMFGPYDLLTFMERIPETWKPYFRLAVGDPEKDADFLKERSPRSYLSNLACPLLVIQGKNDPRVVERESADLVSDLRQQGKDVHYLMFENEGHDVLKFENRVRAYNAITDFFRQYLKP